jgi:hypothetical protein
VLKMLRLLALGVILVALGGFLVVAPGQPGRARLAASWAFFLGGGILAFAALLGSRDPLKASGWQQAKQPPPQQGPPSQGV